MRCKTEGAGEVSMSGQRRTVNNCHVTECVSHCQQVTKTGHVEVAVLRPTLACFLFFNNFCASCVERFKE